MTPWTPTGDKWPQMAMVLVARDIGQGWYSVAVGDNGAGYQVPATMLHPMPSTITPEQEAVLRAAQRQEQAADFDARVVTHRATNEAVRAWRASLAPVDPVAEVKAAWHELLRHKSFQHDAVGRMADAVAALEAKS